MSSGAANESERSACFARLADCTDSVARAGTSSGDPLSAEDCAYLIAAGQGVEEAGWDPWDSERDGRSQSHHELTTMERSVLSSAFVAALRGHPSVLSTFQPPQGLKPKNDLAESTPPFVDVEDIHASDLALSVRVSLPSGDVILEECLPATATAQSLREALSKRGIGGALSEDEVHLFIGPCALRADDALHSFREVAGSDADISVCLLRDAERAGLSELCEEFSQLLETMLIPCANSARYKVVYLAMAGDVYRCLATTPNGDKRGIAEVSARATYEKAVRLAEAGLHHADSIRVYAAVCLSVFCADVLGDRTRACHIARTAFEDAIACGSETPGGCYRHCCTFMQRARDRLTLWTSELDGSMDP